MTESPYTPLERAIAAAIGEIRSLRDHRATLEARVGQLEQQLEACLGDTMESTSRSPNVESGAGDCTTNGRLHQLEGERAAIKSRLRRLQRRLGTLSSAEPEEPQDDHR